MPRDGQGGYVPPLNNWNPALDGNEADPASWNQLLADLTSALSQSVSADGQTMLTGNLKMGGNTLQGMGAPSANGQALRRDQLTKGPNIESASTITIPAEGSVFEVTGTETINQLSGAFDGRMVVLVFQDELIIKHGPNLQLASATDITTKAGDAFVFYRKTSLEWAALYGTTALTEIGTGPDQVPTNELLGSAAYADIVGTMEDGAIIERGSNDNGVYVRFADGTQLFLMPASMSTSAANQWTTSAPQATPATYLSGTLYAVANQGNRPSSQLAQHIVIEAGSNAISWDSITQISGVSGMLLDTICFSRWSL